MSVHESIARRIDEFLTRDEPKHDWVKPAVRAHGFLPLYLGWVAVLGVRPDGSFVRWNYDEDRANVQLLGDGLLRRMAICQGAKQYPELRTLLPERSPSAETCNVCGGSGELPGETPVICHCGGCGWIVPGEAPEPSPG